MEKKKRMLDKALAGSKMRLGISITVYKAWSGIWYPFSSTHSSSGTTYQKTLISRSRLFQHSMYSQLALLGVFCSHTAYLLHYHASLSNTAILCTKHSPLLGQLQSHFVVYIDTGPTLPISSADRNGF